MRISGKTVLPPCALVRNRPDRPCAVTDAHEQKRCARRGVSCRCRIDDAIVGQHDEVRVVPTPCPQLHISTVNYGDIFQHN
jgi:hypothetical protein